MNDPEPVDSRPLRGLCRPDGSITEGQRPARTRRKWNAIVASSMPLEGLRVLDIGCAEGLNALYMSERALEIVGIDHRESAIVSAEKNADALGKRNARFVRVDVRDADAMTALGRFDLITAWGFLHRIADMFTFFDVVSHMTPRVSLEWRTPVLPGMNRLRLAHHPVSPVLDPSNLRLRSSVEKVEGLSAFWEPTVGAVASVGRTFGFERCQVLGYGNAFWSARQQLLHTLFQLMRTSLRSMKRPTMPSARVHTLLAGADDTLFDKFELTAARIPKWDTLMNRG